MISQRRKIFCVGYDTMLTFMGNWKGYSTVSLPLLKGLPEGYRVVSVHDDFARQGFDLLVEHESFAEVSIGGVYPRADGGFADFEIVQIAPLKSDSAILDPEFLVVDRRDPGQSVIIDHGRVVETCRGTTLPQDAGKQPFNAASIRSDRITTTSPEPDPKSAKKSWEFLGPPL